MKWKGFIVIIAVAVYASCNYDNDDNLVYTAHQWVAATDNIGSSFSYDGELIQDGVVSVDFNYVQESNGYPWVSIICDLGHSLQDYKGLTLRYRSDEDLIIHLHQSDFGFNGNRTYSHYQITLPATSIWRTRTVEFEDFAQPDWTPSESLEIPFIPENVRSLHFSPFLNAETGGTASIKIRNLTLF